jgi:hypothetical protein
MNAVKRGIRAKLAGDTGLTTALGGTAIYEALAPQGTDPPYVIYNKQSGAPKYTLGGSAFENQTYMVKVVTEAASMASAGSIHERVNGALTDGALTLTGRTQLYLRRENDVEYVETTDGKRFNHSGALYRVITQ